MRRTMRSATAHCTKINNIGQGRVRAWLECEIPLAPGQFALTTATSDRYLNRALFPVEIQQQGFVIETAPGPEDRSNFLVKPGDTIEILGPVGQAISALAPDKNVLLFGTYNPQVLLPFATQALKQECSVTLALTQPYPVEILDPNIEVRMGKLPQLLNDLLDWADQVFVQPDDETLAHLSQYAQEWDSGSYALISPTMPCGTGACQACAILSSKGWRLTCIDGPMFKLADLYHRAT